MILRLLAFVILVYLLGFLLFSVTLAGPAEGERTDAAVVLTGGAGRIEHAIDVLRDGKVRRVLVSGTDPTVTKSDLAERSPGSGRLFTCCVDLDSTSVDTRSNADEARRWLDRRGFKSVRLITSDYHMRRAHYEFRRVLGPDFEIVTDAVRTEPRFLTLFGEYNDYVIRRIAILLDL